MENTEKKLIEDSIKQHREEIARLYEMLHPGYFTALGQSAVAAINAQSHAEMLRNTDKSGNQLAGTAQHARRKADDTELRKIALAHAVTRHTGEEAVTAAGVYLAFLKGEAARVAQSQFSTSLPNIWRAW